jgi:mannose-6-phosphate isomerase-like protein (cupin superfamily)
MAKNPYVVRIFHPEDAIVCHTSGGPLEVRDFLEPVNPGLKDEITCMMFSEIGDATNVNYHQHGAGLEVFIPTRGKTEIAAQGQITYMIPGDLFVIQPYMSHSFRAVEPNSDFMCLFQDFDMIQSIEKRSYFMKNFPGKYENDKEFHEYYNSETKGSMDRMIPEPIPAPREKVFCLRRKGTGLFEYHYPGIDLYLKAGRWETHGINEYWEADMKKGVTVSWGELRKEWRLFYVYEGVVDFDVNGEKFTVDEPALVRIPPFHPFTMRAVKDACVFDLDCPALLHSMLEELGDPAKKRWPQDPAECREFMHRFNCYITDFDYKPE